MVLIPAVPPCTPRYASLYVKWNPRHGHREGWALSGTPSPLPTSAAWNISLFLDTQEAVNAQTGDPRFRLPLASRADGYP